MPQSQLSDAPLKAELVDQDIGDGAAGSGDLSRGRAVKNLVTLGLSFVLLFTSYQGLSAIQSSFNSSGGLGTAGLAVTYASVVASSLAVAPLVIGRLGPKRAMLAAQVGYLLYLCANLYPHWGTIIPASVMLGLCGAPLWASMSVYTVRLADQYARASPGGAKGRSVVSVFFGVFFTLCASCNVWGNLISFLALSDQHENATAPEGNLSCGHRFCSAAASNVEDTGGQAERPPMSKFYIMMGCFIATAGLSILVMLVLVDRNDEASDRRSFSLAELGGNLKAMVAQMGDSRQLLLVILTVNVGLSQSFAVGEFTEGFVACSSGIAAVGRVMMCYGAGQVASGFIFGQVAGWLGKEPVLVAAASVQLTMEALALAWQVAPEPAWLFYVFAFVWGCVDTVWNSQMNALYGEYFANKTDAAFSAYRFWESMGYIIGFSYNKLLCINQKLNVMLAVLSVGVLGLVVGAIVNRRKRASEAAKASE